MVNCVQQQSQALGDLHIIVRINGMKVLIAIFIICASLTGCMTRENDALRVLSSMGYTDIVFTGYRFFMCGKGDDFSTGFTAKGTNGLFVSGTVCSGFFKGSTVRLD